MSWRPATNDELVAWTRAFGLNRLLRAHSEQIQLEWEKRLIEQAATWRRNGIVRLGGLTRVVVAEKAN